MDLSALGEVERDAELLRGDGGLGVRWNAVTKIVNGADFWLTIFVDKIGEQTFFCTARETRETSKIA